MSKKPVQFRLNGSDKAVFVEDGQNLLETLRRGIGDFAPKYGCGQGACGVCTSDMASFLDTYSEEVKKRNPMPRRVGHEPPVLRPALDARGSGRADRRPRPRPGTIFHP